MRSNNSKIPYSIEALYQRGKPRRYRGRELDNLAFPLGGIGTGSISLGGWGQLRDFEIFNKPHKGLLFNYTFFSLFTQKGDTTTARVIQGPVGGSDFIGSGSGLPWQNGSGLPRFESVEFTGAFPFARLDFHDSEVPLEVGLEAFNPFIPLNPDDSSLPVAMFNFHLRNPGNEPVRAVVFASLENKTGYPDTGPGLIEYFASGGVQGLKMATHAHQPGSPRFGTLALATSHADLNVQTHWYRGRWFDSLHRFWDEVQRGQLEENRQPAESSRPEVGALGLRVNLRPGETAYLPVWIAWHNPNVEMYWSAEDPKPIWRNYYANLFADAEAVAEYVGHNQARLEGETRRFAEALFGSTLPEAVLDAISSQISILKTTTCLRLQDGSFYAWEGCNPEAGCCEGTCTHVWNYAQALPYLFPSLERSVRQADYAYNQQANGHMTFRMPLPLGTRASPSFFAAADGQMGGVMKVYRDWQICGDDAWLRRLWPAVKRSLEYAWLYWDRDRDGVMEGVQHNTYDIEFFGPNTMMGSFYLGALRAAEEMARYLGEPEKATEYHELFAQGRAKMDASLFNGEYYFQQVQLQAKDQSSHDLSISMAGVELDPLLPDYPKYQYGKGCLSDQLIGQWFAHMVRLGYLFEPENVRNALSAIFTYNWKSGFTHHVNPQRIYAVNEEAGLLCASWPRGERPGLPFVYSDEVWSGIEYQVASHLIYEGLIDEGLAVVKGARDRYTGLRRNPWDEIECGHHYARSMASYALLLALSDFFYSAPSQSLHFAPRIYPQDFACFFSVDSGYGMLRQNLDRGGWRASVEIISGELRLKQLELGFEAADYIATMAGKALPLSTQPIEGGARLVFADPLVVTFGEPLVVAAVLSV
jgi:non-lysosomal glucosylceramidase